MVEDKTMTDIHLYVFAIYQLGISTTLRRKLSTFLPDTSVRRIVRLKEANFRKQKQ